MDSREKGEAIDGSWNKNKKKRKTEARKEGLGSRVKEGNLNLEP
jgi:hypothetical protein